MSSSAQAAARSRRESAGAVTSVRMTCASHANRVTRGRRGRMAALGVGFPGIMPLHIRGRANAEAWKGGREVVQFLGCRRRAQVQVRVHIM
jgi:hypothetical protein